MCDIISKDMKISQIRQILNEHGLINLPYKWEISLWLVFNTYGDRLKVVGYGENAGFETIDGD